MEALGSLAGGIAHDFNNILVPILGLTELTKRMVPADGDASRNLQNVLKAAERARDLVKQILVFSRDTPVNRIPLDLCVVLTDVLDLLRQTIPATVELRYALNADAGLIFADPTEIHQIILNLVTNSLHALKGRGVIEIELDSHVADAEQYFSDSRLQPGSYVRLTIRDNGCGMDEKTVQRIFDPFFTTKQVGEGTGLGLSVVHGIVTRYEGVIHVESKAGEGTRFDIYFSKHAPAGLSLAAGAETRAVANVK
jgi:signal transduction histidine kinase